MYHRIAGVAVLLWLADPAMAQTDGQPFRVFFDWAKPELTRDAQAILDDAVAEYQRTHPDRVTVSGHSDRSGPAAFNLGASRRRAEAVRTYLIAKGIPASALRVAAFGESQPIITTEDGVREAQNRRVEILFDSGANPNR